MRGAGRPILSQAIVVIALISLCSRSATAQTTPMTSPSLPNAIAHASNASLATDPAPNPLTFGVAPTQEGGHGDAPDLRELMTPPNSLREIIERYATDRDSLTRKYPIEISTTRANRLRSFTTDWLNALERLDFDTLSPDARIDYVLFRNHLSHELRRLDLWAKRQAEIAPLVPFTTSILGLEEARTRMATVDPEKIAAQLTELTAQVEQVQRTIEAQIANTEGPKRYKPTVANRAAEQVQTLQQILDHWFSFYHGYDPLFTWWVDEPYKALAQSLPKYTAFLKEKVVGVRPDDTSAIIGDPIGREALLAELQYEMIPYTPEELVAIAKQELAWCDVEMRRASHELGYGDDWHRALEHVKNLHVEPGKQPLLIRDLALEAIEFLDKHDLVTIPPLARETWRMEMMSPEQQLVNPFFLGGETIQVSYPTNTMTQEQKLMSMRGNNRYFARATVQHELIPGHHLQGYMAQRYRPYRQLFSTPFYIEGWALYWEMLLWVMKFARSPEDRIGMLFWRMHRCARIIFSLSFHLEQMTPQQCIDFLVDRVGHERANATAEVRRSFQGDYPPLYQCAYLLGGLQIRAMRHELVDSGKMTDRAFHDAILQQNEIPIEMVRAALTHQPLDRNFVSGWKFYGQIAPDAKP
jgi:uncharacterized protein (DUF885 family)